MMHLFYVIMMIIYINIAYINYSDEVESQIAVWTVLLGVGILYPALYDWTQMFKSGLDYFSDPWNYADMIYIWSSVVTLVLQNVIGPAHLISKIFMIIIVFLALIKTFFFLRIFTALSPIVTMLTNVIYDLRIFMFFYSILIVMFALHLGILGIGNPYVPGIYQDKYYPYQEDDNSAEAATRRFLKPKGAGKGNKGSGDDAANSPIAEYNQINLATAYLITTLRMSMGDFGFDTANMLSPPLNGIYWAIWLIIVVVTNIIFLNFIIAEACSSYENVACNLNAFILMERAALI